MSLIVILFDSDAAWVNALSNQLRPLSCFKALRLDAKDIMRLPNLDAIALPFSAAEKWGGRRVPGVAYVLPTSAPDWKVGWPRFVVAGGALTPEEAQRPLQHQFMQTLRATKKAVDEFNETHPGQIRTLAFAYGWVRKLAPREVVAAILETGLWPES